MSEPVRQYRFQPAPGACDLLLVRHGESAPAVEGQPFPTVGGHADPPLDPQGQDEGRRVAERLKGEEISAIYVTTLQRTQQTAAPLATQLGLEPRVEPELREVFLGEWEGGLLRIRAREQHPIAKEMFEKGDWGIIPGAEPREDFARRVRAGITRIAEAHPDQRVVAFVHGGVIGMVMHLACGSHPFAFVGAENGSINHIVVTEDRWIVRRFNDTGHLATDLDKPIQPLT